MEPEKMHCDFCGCEIAEGDGMYVEGGLLCNDCVDEQTVTCEHYGDVIWSCNSVSDGNIELCQECFDRHYRRCESCDRIVNENDTYWENDLPYCCGCYEEICDEEIEDYDYKPDPIFYGNGNRFFGVELEIDEGGKDNDNARQLKDLANYRDERIYIKSDGSLNYGMEIVSHPMTLEYHLREMNWESLLEEAIEMGYLSHHTSTCGLHVHVNRNAFGENQSEQEKAIEKILFFVEKHWSEVFQFSRRNGYTVDFCTPAFEHFFKI